MQIKLRNNLLRQFIKKHFVNLIIPVTNLAYKSLALYAARLRNVVLSSLIYYLG